MGEHEGRGPGGMRNDMTREQHEQMRKFDETERELQVVTQRYGESIRESGKEITAETRDELKKLVAKHFEVRQERREFELKVLMERLEKLRKAVEDRKTRKDEIVQKRVDELLGERKDEF